MAWSIKFIHNTNLPGVGRVIATNDATNPPFVHSEDRVDTNKPAEVQALKTKVVALYQAHQAEISDENATAAALLAALNA